jgi:hypothetical protein
MEQVSNFIILLSIIVAAGWSAWRITKVKWSIQDEIEKSRREILKDGKKYSVVTIPRQTVREIKTGRRGIVVDRSRENTPTIINGQMELVPRWIKVRYILQTQEFSKISGWRRSGKFDFEGLIDVDEYETI